MLTASCLAILPYAHYIRDNVDTNMDQREDVPPQTRTPGNYGNAYTQATSSNISAGEILATPDHPET